MCRTPTVMDGALPDKWVQVRRFSTGKKLSGVLFTFIYTRPDLSAEPFLLK